MFMSYTSSCTLCVVLGSNLIHNFKIFALDLQSAIVDTCWLFCFRTVCCWLPMTSTMFYVWWTVHVSIHLLCSMYLLWFVILVYYRLLVGAPLDQNAQPDTNRSGALWRCPLTTLHTDCDQVITDGKRGEPSARNFDLIIERKKWYVIS